VSRLWDRAWFWLTNARDCAWCKTRIHRAWIPLPPKRLTDSIRLPRVTSGICRECTKKVLHP
jgi:DNA polymerase III epsilon subunit-like protein